MKPCEKDKASRSSVFLSPIFPVILAALLRLPLLGEIPNGFYSDEACIGYDAYSMLKTG
tara:strand:+ start:88 stop:264 length:177 start_codon:yes stop_codon:yes gene_type:complete